MDALVSVIYIPNKIRKRWNIKWCTISFKTATPSTINARSRNKSCTSLKPKWKKQGLHRLGFVSLHCVKSVCFWTNVMIYPTMHCIVNKHYSFFQVYVSSFFYRLPSTRLNSEWGMTLWKKKRKEKETIAKWDYNQCQVYLKLQSVILYPTWDLNPGLLYGRLGLLL